MINVLVIFDSCSGATEALALAAAVGAVQARANIRMRRLPDHSTASSETLARMRREYVPPTPADTLWADAVIIGVHRKVCGVVDNSSDATAFGRRMVEQTRAVLAK
jgi:multimeric flavodoxin WrbA